MQSVTSAVEASDNINIFHATGLLSLIFWKF